MGETLTEQEHAPGGHSVGLITLVLQYDDLLGDVCGQWVLDDLSRVVIGRGAPESARAQMGGCRLTLPDRWASAQHAIVEPAGDGAHRLTDSGSRNGTHVAGQRIATQILNDGDLFEIGHSLLCYRRVEARLVEPLLSASEGIPLGPTTTRNPELADIALRLKAVAATREPVLLLGETGTGKEVVAQAVHAWSRRPGQFRAVDCGAIPESLMESAFFGHRRGAFTGAVENRTGELVLAHRGTLFLDEVANMGQSAQAKFLRSLETGEVTPLGASAPERLDLRLLSAANRDILADPQGFRLDLLNRLAGFVARLPPLVRRREDLGQLTRHLLREAGATTASIRVAAARRLYGSTLPGNVRQLRAVLRSALALSQGEPIDVRHLPPLDGRRRSATQVAASAGAGPTPRPPAARTASLTMPSIEVALQRNCGNVVHAARDLDVHPRQLYRVMRRLDIDPARFRQSRP